MKFLITLVIIAVVSVNAIFAAVDNVSADINKHNAQIEQTINNAQ